MTRRHRLLRLARALDDVLTQERARAERLTLPSPPTVRGSSTGPERWTYQLRRSTEQAERIRGKIAADPMSTRALGWRERLAATERDITNYLTALHDAGIALPE